MRAIHHVTGRASLRLQQRQRAQSFLAGSQRVLPCYYSTKNPLPKDASFAAKLREEMLARPPTLIQDHLSPTRSRLLDLALADFLPDSAKLPRSNAGVPTMPPGHHLVYFPPMLTESQLLPDGTDPNHSPGTGFSRRMWAGGSVDFPAPLPGHNGEVTATVGGDLHLSGPERFCACRESVSDVTVRGQPGAEKVYIDLLREYGNFPQEQLALPATERALQVRVSEHRTLVFLCDDEVERDAARAQAQTPPAARRAVRAPHEPDYSFDLTPSRRLLFHFSALTHNAHLIHLDREYCRAREGHRDLLVHGPLSLVLMLTATQAAAARIVGPAHTSWVQSIRYRNLAPLYVGESMRVCVRRVPGATFDSIPGGPPPIDSWDVWIESPDGGMAVKASAETCGLV